VLPLVANNKFSRTIGLLDIIKDPTIYNASITPQLMKYNVMYNQVTPYGKATPNRTGFDLELNYKDSAEQFKTNLSAQALQDTRGEGTTQLRNYGLINWNGTIAFDKIYNFKKTLELNAGIQYATSQRDGQNLVKDVNLKSQAIDAGAVIELVNRLDFLVGTKLVFAKGTEYVDLRDSYNQITGFNQVSLDCYQVLDAASLRYRFTDNVTFSIQESRYNSVNRNNSKENYSINQFYMLFKMIF
jgi:hypothetical protein